MMTCLWPDRNHCCMQFLTRSVQSIFRFSWIFCSRSFFPMTGGIFPFYPRLWMIWTTTNNFDTKRDTQSVNSTLEFISIVTLYHSGRTKVTINTFELMSNDLWFLITNGTKPKISTKRTQHRKDVLKTELVSNDLWFLITNGTKPKIYQTYPTEKGCTGKIFRLVSKRRLCEAN